MGEAVAIISVSASAIVGISGVVAAAWGSSRQRRWQSHEERAIELRGVLEDGGAKVAELLIKIDGAHDEVWQLRHLTPDRKKDLELTQKSIVFAIDRIGIRRGSRAPEYKTLGSYWRDVEELVTILEEAKGERLTSDQEAAYERRWDHAIAAQKAYLDATAETLAVDPPSMLKRMTHRSGRTATNSREASR
jgi:hypothetical protein